MKQQIIEAIAFPVALIVVPIVLHFVGVRLGRAVAWIVGSILIWQHKRKKETTP